MTVIQCYGDAFKFFCAQRHTLQMYEICMQIGEWLKGAAADSPPLADLAASAFLSLNMGDQLDTRGVRHVPSTESSGGRSVSCAALVASLHFISAVLPAGATRFWESARAPDPILHQNSFVGSARATQVDQRRCCRCARFTKSISEYPRLYGGTDAGSVATPDRIYEIAAPKLAAAAWIASRYLLHWPFLRFTILSDDNLVYYKYKYSNLNSNVFAKKLRILRMNICGP